jgi:hypothetical protein
MRKNFEVAFVSLLVCLASGCATVQEPRVNFGAAQAPALILAGSPQVYARESLINLRRDDMAWLKGLLDEFDDEGFRNRFGADVVRQVEIITAIQASLSAKIDSGLARTNQRTDELAAAQHEIAMEQKLQELRDLIEADLEEEVDPNARQKTDDPAAGAEAASAGAEAEEAETTPDPAPDGGSVSESHARATALIAEIDARLEELRDRDTNGSALSAITANPRDQLRDMLAYREDLNSLHNELQLDDLHDADGNGLYKLRIPVTVVPGSTQDRFGTLRYEIEPPVHDNDYYFNLYLRWLGHLTNRLNLGFDNIDGSQLADRELQFFGAASRLFVPTTFYVATKRDQSSLFDPCLSAGSRVQAEALGVDCMPFTVALPYEVGKDMTRLFPELEHLIIPMMLRSADTAPETGPDGSFDNRFACVPTEVDLRQRVKAKLPAELHHNPLIDEIVLIASIDYLAAAQQAYTDADCRTDPTRPDRVAAAIVDKIADSIEASYQRELARAEKKAANGTPPKACGTSEPRDSGSQANAGGSNKDGNANPIKPEASRDIERADGVLSSILQYGESMKSQSQLEFDFGDIERPSSDLIRIRTVVDAAERYKRDLAPSIAAARNYQETRARAEQCLNSALMVARSKLSRQDVSLLIRRDRIEKVLEAASAVLRYMAPIAQGLAQRQDVSDVARRGSELALQSLFELSQLRERVGLGTNASSAPVQPADCPDDSTSYSRFYCSLDDAKKSGRINIYSVAPTELAQRVDTSASAVEAISLAAALSVADPLGGRSMGGEFGFGRETAARARAMERIPLVVSYATAASYDKDGTPPEKQVAQHAGFGWIFGPRQRVVSKSPRDVIEFSFPPSSFDVAVDLAVPAWWEEVILNETAVWIGDLSQAASLVTKPTETSGGPKRMKLKLPSARRSLDSLTRVLAEGYGGAPPTARIAGVVPSELNLCGNEVTMAIRGQDLWRGASVMIEGVRAKDDDVKVLPDMEGLLVRFETSALQVPLTGLVESQVSVLTQNGIDTHPIFISRKPGDKPACGASSPVEKKNATLIPAEIHRCDTRAEFVLRSVDGTPADEMAIRIGSREVKATCVRPVAAPSGSAGAKTACLDFAFTATLDPKFMRGRDQLPVYAMGRSGVETLTVKLVGDDKVCGGTGTAKVPAAPAPAGSTRVDGVAVISHKDGALLGCRKEAELTVTGAGLDKLKSINLLGVEGTSRQVSAAGDLRIYHFEGLPRVGDKEAPPAGSVPVHFKTADDKPLGDQSIKWVACS